MAVTLDGVVQRGHAFGIVDEVDSILVDEARTPLIISGEPETAAQVYYDFARAVKALDGHASKVGEEKNAAEASGADYAYDEKHKTVSPMQGAIEKAERMLGIDNLYDPRDDKNDQIFKTKEAKYNAVIEDIKERHAKGQPVLVGTISVEVSEHLGQLLQRQGIPHNVLNAKQHEKEAGIIAEAGQSGAVTI